MILLEEEAKTCTCQETFNSPHGLRNCITSQCMAWRWATDEQEAGAGYTASETKGNLTGYCGKAGIPS